MTITASMVGDAANNEYMYSAMRYVTNMHKALDFSNIGMPAPSLLGDISLVYIRTIIISN